jgi:hypothetical protein
MDAIIIIFLTGNPFAIIGLLASIGTKVSGASVANEEPIAVTATHLHGWFRSISPPCFWRCVQSPKSHGFCSPLR